MCEAWPPGHRGSPIAISECLVLSVLANGPRRATQAGAGRGVGGGKRVSCSLQARLASAPLPCACHPTDAAARAAARSVLVCARCAMIRRSLVTTDWLLQVLRRSSHAACIPILSLCYPLPQALHRITAASGTFCQFVVLHLVPTTFSSSWPLHWAAAPRGTPPPAATAPRATRRARPPACQAGSEAAAVAATAVDAAAQQGGRHAPTCALHTRVCTRARAACHHNTTTLPPPLTAMK